MANSDPKSKIIELGKRAEAGATQKIGELLSACEARTISLLSDCLQALFERVDDSLFDMAERADSNQVQTQYFDGMREIRRQQASVVSEFKKQLSRGFREFASGRSAVPSQHAEQADGDGLALVENDELEQSLAMTNMVARSETRLSSALHALNERMGMVRGGSGCETEENPAGPNAVAYAFQQGAEHWDIEIRVRLLILKLFEKHALSKLPELYGQLNKQLAEAGVLPNLKYTLPRPRVPGAGAPIDPAALATPGEPAGEEDRVAVSEDPLQGAGIESVPADADSALEQQLFATMQSLLNARRARVVSAAPQHQVPAYQPNDVLNALSMLQSQVQSLAENPQAYTAQPVAALPKAELISQIQEVSGHNEGALASGDEDAIDLVSMLFEYILEDTNLPSVIQATLARLQIPYLKVAVLDRHLFAQRSHPARRLLDALARSGIGWTEDADRNEKLLGKIREIVERVLSEFKDDLSLFEHLLEDFETFLQRTQRRSMATEKRTTEATRGRERLLQARRQAAQEILARMGEQEVPEVIRYLLTRPWANVLVLILLRQSEESKEWADALKLVDELVWSCTSVHNDEECQQLRRRLPWIERQLRLGLRLVAMHEDDIERHLQDVADIHQRVLRGEPALQSEATDQIASQAEPVAEQDAAPGTDRQAQAETEATQTQPASAPSPTPSSALPPARPGEGFVEEIILESQNSEPEPVSESIDDDFTTQARKLIVGAWIEFTDQAGEVSRAKLSWISPITNNFLFVNRNGIKVCDKSLNAMAIEFRRGSARVLEDVPLFDRALDAIVSRLRKDSKDSDEEPATDADSPD